jgi:hypothetical protein
VHSAGQEARISAFLRQVPTPLPGAYYNGQEDYRRTIETSPWYASFRQRAGYGLSVSDGDPFSFGDEGPQLFVHEGARRALERRFSIPVTLAVTDNRQSLVTYRHRRVRVHAMFLDAPEAVQKALASYVLERRDDKHVMGDYVRANVHRIRAAKIASPLRAQGHVHDLEAIFDKLNDRYFDGLPAAEGVQITWGRRAARGARERMKLGSYSVAERLIRIHPVLDGAWVPDYFVEHVVYHELLHHVVAPVARGSRMLKHPPEFRRREKLFSHHDRAIMWECGHMEKLLGAS